MKCDVSVTFFDHSIQNSSPDFTNFEIIEDIVNINNISCTNYTERPDLLQASSNRGKIKWGSHLLRSNCKITHQPDWGSIYISMEGRQLPTPESFLKYTVSLRNENHFHEEICEMVFKRLLNKYCPKSLMVACLYTRRGGIDINPVRSLSINDFPIGLYNPKLKSASAFRQ